MNNDDLLKILDGTRPNDASTGLVNLLDDSAFELPAGAKYSFDFHPDIPEQLVDVVECNDAKAYWCDPAVMWCAYEPTTQVQS